jgi:shikimate kinase
MTDGKNYGTVKLCGGIVVFIDTPFPYCQVRIRREPGKRPLADNKNDDELLELFNTRHPLYEKNSDCKVDGVDPSLVIVAGIMTEIVKLIEQKTDEDIAAVDQEQQKVQQKEQQKAGETAGGDSSTKE